MPYLYLFLAIIGELTGTSLLKLSDGFTKLFPTLGSLVAYGLCFYFLSLSLKGVPLNIAYATWSGLGLVLMAILSVLLFKESLNLYSILGIILIVTGVLILNLFGNVEH